VENNGDHSVSLAKIEANRRNAKRSTWPKTEEGKSRSRRNAVKHGLLASTVVIHEEDRSDKAEFDKLLLGLQSDLIPVGKLEELLVDKIAVCWWRQKRALECEINIIPGAFRDVDSEKMFTDFPLIHRVEAFTRTLGAQMDRILRYQTTIHRELVHSLNQLERLQRARKGEHVPAPVSVQVSTDQ
jgi:hypothetical protein